MNTATRQGFITVLLHVLVLLLLVFVAPPHAAAITFNDAGFFSEPIATLAPFKPVGVTFAPDGRIFIWQRDGVIRIVKNGALLPTPFMDISSKVNTYTDHGFLGVALDPNFAANGFVYVFYTYEAGGNPNDTAPKTGHLSRVTADPTNPDVVLANSEVILLGSLDVPPCSNYPVGADCFPTDSYTHSVGSLRFLADGTLFASHGDGGTADFATVLALRSQSLDSYAGKILRINPDGTAPQAPLTVNPFNDGSNSIRSKVWAYGLRNPFRVGLHPTTGLPYIGDVGWNTWEEINQGAAGANYGWPCWEGNAPQPLYQASFPTQCQPVTAATFPLYTYDRSVGSTAIGGSFFTGPQYPAAYRGNFFIADYSAKWMKRIVFDGSGNLQSVVDFASNIGTIDGGPVAIELGPDGLLYYVVFTTGEVARIRHTSGSGSNFPPFGAAAASPPNGYSPLNVGFSSAGSSDPEGGALTYLWDFGDGATSTAPNPFHTYTAAGVTTFPVLLTVTDPLGAKFTASLKVVVGSTPPVATIDLPASGPHFTVGQTATYHGSATDPDDGPVPNSALHWTVLLHHNTHIHPFIETTGSGGSFPVDNHDPTGTWSFEFQLTATDSAGLTDTKSITVPVNPPPPSAPVLLYGMNEGSGTTVADASGTGHTGTLVNGPAWVAGQATYGQALSFDGVDDAVTVANPAALNFGTADFTIELWAKRNVLGGAQRHLFSKCHSTGWQSGCKELYFNANNQLTFGSSATGDTVAATIADTNWHHVAVTFTSSAQALRIYVDGALVTTATKALEVDNAAHVVTIGNLFGANTFSGMLDEVRIYSRALTLAEIQTDRATPITTGSDTTPPSTVTGLTATAVSSSQINLAWTAATDNVGVTGYRMERCQGAACSSFAQIATPAGTTFGDTGLTAATKYSYRVKAMDAANNVSVNYSTVASATTQAVPPDTTPPSAVTGLIATAISPTQINLSWLAAIDNVGVTGYRVERCQGAGCTNFVQIATPITNSYSNPGLTAGTRYSYRVKAMDAANNVSVNYSTVASATTQAAPPDTTPPSAVTGLIATAISPTQINLSWLAAIDNVGVTGYRVERCQGAGCTNFVQIATPITNSYSNPGLTAGTRYSYRVKAMDAANNVSVNYSTVASATTQAAPPDTTPPSAVTGLIATAISPTQINLSWLAAIDNVGVTGYRVERCQRAGCTSFVQIATPAATTFGDMGLTPSTTYRYRVRAVDAAGKLGPYSGISTATTLTPPDTIPPTAPGTPTAKPSGKTQIHLKWRAATDNVGVIGYRVERCIGAACGNFVEVEQPTHTNFHDKGLIASTTYRYRVRAFDATGNLGPYSGISTATIKGHSSKDHSSSGHDPDDRGGDTDHEADGKDANRSQIADGDR